MPMHPLHLIKRVTGHLIPRPSHNYIDSGSFQSLESPFKNFVTFNGPGPGINAHRAALSYPDKETATEASYQLIDLMLPRGMRRLTKLGGEQPAYFGGKSFEETPEMVSDNGDSKFEYAWLQLAAHIMVPAPHHEHLAGDPISNQLFGSCSNGSVSCSCPIVASFAEQEDNRQITYLAVEWDTNAYLSKPKAKLQVQELQAFQQSHSKTIRMLACLLSSGTLFWTPVTPENGGFVDQLLEEPEH